MFVKAYCLRVLFVDRQLVHGICIRCIQQQMFAYAAASVFGGDEQHFEFLSVYPRKSYINPVLVFGNYQMRYFTERLRNMIFYLFDFAFR